MTLAGRRILLVVGGGIAAYKALDLVRRLRERGAAVRPVLTAGAQRFVTPLAAAALAGERAHTDLFDRETEADVVAPATANLMAKMANGLADDLASTILLATTLPILLAPAMNVRMWQHPATRRNLERLVADGVHVVGPNEGRMAEAEWGPGRLAEPVEIADAVERVLVHAGVAEALAPRSSVVVPGDGEAVGKGIQGLTTGPAPDPLPLRFDPAGDDRRGSWHGQQHEEGSEKSLAGRRVLVTSGPTHEPIDPVRYIANRSSGRQGHAIAAAAAAAGAEVTLVSGPVALADPPGVAVIRVETAREMLAAVEAALPADIAVFAAAVADWRAAGEADQKLKKDGAEPPPLRLVLNPDILALVAHRTEGRPAFVVGFAAETESVLDHARAKLARKGCDLVVANDVTPATGIMGGTRNSVHLVTRDGVETWPTLEKEEVARRLVATFATSLADILAATGAGRDRGLDRPTG